MKRQVTLLGLFLSLLVVFALGTATLVFAEPTRGGVADLGLKAGPNGSLMHWYSADIPDGYTAMLATQQPDGSVKTRYFKTVAEYDAAVAAMGCQPENSRTSEITGSSSGTLSTPVGTLSVKTVTVTTHLYDPSGAAKNRLITALSFNYSGSTVSSANYWSSSGWWSPWVRYGSALASLSGTPAVSVRLDVFQAYTTGTYNNALRNITDAFGSGSYSTAYSTWAVDSRLIGWTYGRSVSVS